MSCNLAINELPPEILDKIFCYFSLEEICRTIALVCKKWYQLAQNPIHWKVINPKNIPSTEELHVLISKAPLLVAIDLSNQSLLCDEILLHITKSCPHLQSIILSFCDKTSIGLLDYEWLHHCDNVTYLDVQGSSKWVTDKFISHLHHVPKLTGLNALYCNHITDSGLELLADEAPHLTSIYLDGVQFLTDSGMCKFVLQLGHQLIALTIDGEGLTDQSLNTITQSCPQLQTFHVSFSDGFTDSAIIELKRLNLLRSLRLKKPNGTNSTAWLQLFDGPGMSALTSLHLEECETLRDDGLCQIAKCCGARIKCLDLSWCWNVTDEGLSVIVETCRSLEYLILVGLKDITDLSLWGIPQIQPLRFLDLTQCNQIDDDTIKDIVKVKGNIVINNYYGEVFRSSII